MSRDSTSWRGRNSNEIVRADIRLLDEQETQKHALRAALVAGEESGPAEQLDIEAFLADKHG